jgi:hypothetical protein
MSEPNISQDDMAWLNENVGEELPVEKAEEKTPVPTVVSEETAPFQVMDFADDEQILAEVQGKGAAIAEEWIYSFRQKDGKEVTGLSWLGTKNAAYWFRRKKMADLFITDLTVEEDPTDPEYKLVKASCEDKINGGKMWGVKRQWTKMKLRDGSTVIDPFWYEKGTSKAQRNAMQSMMPADWITKLIKEWTGLGKIKSLEAPPKKDFIESKRVASNTEPHLENPPCPVCQASTTLREGVSKAGKKWAGYFCTESREHEPQWIK